MICRKCAVCLHFLQNWNNERNHLISVQRDRQTVNAIIIKYCYQMITWFFSWCQLATAFHLNSFGCFVSAVYFPTCGHGLWSCFLTVSSLYIQGYTVCLSSVASSLVCFGAAQIQSNHKITFAKITCTLHYLQILLLIDDSSGYYITSNTKCGCMTKLFF